MDEIERRFNQHFAHWGIRLPPGNVEQRRSGQILQAGWAIWYRFGEDMDGEYLDYYASHRMTEDEHVRLRDFGATEWLPAIVGMRLCSGDPVEEARLAEEHHARNAEVSRMLEEIGFGLQGDEPGGVQINRALRLHWDQRPPLSKGGAADQADDGAPEWAAPRGCQPALSWELHDGRTVRLDGFFLDLTYGGLLEGLPSAATNDRILSELQSRARSLFGEEPFIMSAVAVGGPKGGLWLPPFRYAACLCSEPVGTDASGSVMVVCGFAPPFLEKPLTEFLVSISREIDWTRHSRDFLH